jgi:hypothetical protein
LGSLVTCDNGCGKYVRATITAEYLIRISQRLLNQETYQIYIKIKPTVLHVCERRAKTDQMGSSLKHVRGKYSGRYMAQ